MTLGRIRDRAALPALKNLLGELSKGVGAVRLESLKPDVHGSVVDLRPGRDAALMNAVSEAVQAIEAGADHAEAGADHAEAGLDNALQRESLPGIGGWATVAPNVWDD